MSYPKKTMLLEKISEKIFTNLVMGGTSFEHFEKICPHCFFSFSCKQIKNPEMCITWHMCFKQIKKNLKNFFSPVHEQDKKEITEFGAMCTIGGPFESSETCSHESGSAILRLLFFFSGRYSPNIFPPAASQNHWRGQGNPPTPAP